MSLSACSFGRTLKDLRMIKKSWPNGLTVVVDQPGHAAESCLTSNLCVVHQGKAGDGGRQNKPRDEHGCAAYI